MPEFTIPICFFDSEHDVRPKAKQLAYGELVSLLTTHEERNTKSGQLFSPVTYKDGTTRSKEGVKTIHCMVLDFDHGVNWAETKPRLEGREYIAHSTFRHTREENRFRVVLPFSRPVSVFEWPEVQSRAHALFEGCDPAAKDPSRIFYLPSCLPGAARFSEHHAGELLDPDELPSLPMVVSEPSSTLSRDLSPYNKAALEGELSELRHSPEGQRNDQLNRSAFSCGQLIAGTGLDEAEARRHLVSVALQIGLTQHEVDRTVDSGIAAGKKEPRQVQETSQTKVPVRLVIPGPVNCSNISDVRALFDHWLYLEDNGLLDVFLATVAANHGFGDPVWTIGVGAPGGGKTETLNSLSPLPDVYPVAVLSEGALLSGTPRKDRASTAKGGLLKEMGEFGILAIKDFGSILSMNRDAKGPVLAALREIYDGSWTRYFGTDGGHNLHWEGKCGVIACATPSIDSHYAVMASLGERFAFYRLPEVNECKLAEKALRYAGREKQMRTELAGAVASLFASVKPPNDCLDLSDFERNKLVALASFATRCRSAVERDSTMNREICLVPGAEAPTRLVKMLAMLLGGLDAIGVDRQRAWQLVEKVALDSMPQLRRRVVDVLLKDPAKDKKTTEIATALGYPSNTVRRTLEDIACYNIVIRESGGSGQADTWHLSDWTLETYKQAVTLPETWEDEYPYIEPSNLPTHICGKPTSHEVQEILL